MEPILGRAGSTNDPAKAFGDYTLDFTTPCDPGLQAKVEALDARLRAALDATSAQTAVGVLDLRRLRLAMVHPDRIEYGASVPKIGILLAYFALRPDAATNLAPEVRRELGLMIRQSSNELAAKFSQELGLRSIQAVLDAQGLYDANHGGGIWVGKHYGVTGERFGDPVADHSHAVTVRQLLRFYLRLEQGRLLSTSASLRMREVFASPDIPPVNDKFVRGLAGLGVDIIRKAGWWEDWSHDSAVVTGPGRHYILVGLTHHPKGDDYLVALAKAVDDLLLERCEDR